MITGNNKGNNYKPVKLLSNSWKDQILFARKPSVASNQITNRAINIHFQIDPCANNLGEVDCIYDYFWGLGFCRISKVIDERRRRFFSVSRQQHSF